MRGLNLLALLSMMISSGLAFANGITLGEPGYGGTGCPSGSASATLSPDSKSLSIIFDQYIVEAGRSVGKTMDRKSCNIAIPVYVPQGYSISVIGVDYRGFMALPMGGEGRLNAEYFFAGQRGPMFSKMFRGPQDDDYLFTNTIGVEAVVWSACGADVNLRVNSSMLVKSNSRGETAMATVDSADFQAGLVYHFQWKRCY